MTTPQNPSRIIPETWRRNTGFAKNPQNVMFLERLAEETQIRIGPSYETLWQAWGEKSSGGVLQSHTGTPTYNFISLGLQRTGKQPSDFPYAPLLAYGFQLDDAKRWTSNYLDHRINRMIYHYETFMGQSALKVFSDDFRPGNDKNLPLIDLLTSGYPVATAIQENPAYDVFGDPIVELYPVAKTLSVEELLS